MDGYTGIAGRYGRWGRAWALIGCLAVTGCIDRTQSTSERADAMPRDAADAMPGLPDGANPPTLDAIVHDLDQRMPPDSGDGMPDAMPDVMRDAMPDGRVPEWDAVVDPQADAGPLEPGPSHFVEYGQCFEHSPRCRVAADCAEGVCVEGRCQPRDRPCGCASDGDCGEAGAVCVTNERVCGQCTAPQALCVDGACHPPRVCVDGFCRDDCPGLDDGPPLRCRGEPPPGDCLGAWAYLREAGTCVPVDRVRCGPEDNAFANRAECLARCRGPVACLATVEARPEGGRPRRVTCPITQGPGACVALAHCFCEASLPDLPPATAREELRQCAFSLTVPRGALTFADFCGQATLDVVVANVQAVGFLGPDTRFELTPGCASVATDGSVGPFCADGIANGWETGVDCGPMGCAACE